MSWHGWERYQVTPKGCWEWTGPRNEYNYGVTSEPATPQRGASQLAHRIAWEKTHGAIPAGMNVCHRCDNPPCIRPEHLFLGTQSDNMRDAWRKGRLRIPTQRLTLEQREQLRAEGATTPSRMLAQRYAISRSRVSELLRGVQRPREVVRPVEYKLSDEQIVLMRNRVAQGEKQSDVAASFGVAQSYVSRVVNRVVRGDCGGLAAPSTNHWRRLTDAQVRDAYRRAQAGETHQAIADSMGVTREAITKIARGKAHQDVTGGGPIPKRRQLTDAERDAICARASGGETHKKIAESYGVSRSLVQLIVAKRRG